MKMSRALQVSRKLLACCCCIMGRHSVGIPCSLKWRHSSLDAGHSPPFPLVNQSQCWNASPPRSDVVMLLLNLSSSLYSCRFRVHTRAAYMPLMHIGSAYSLARCNGVNGFDDIVAIVLSKKGSLLLSGQLEPCCLQSKPSHCRRTRPHSQAHVVIFSEDATAIAC